MNDSLIILLTTLGDYYSQSNDQYRSRQYHQAANIIATINSLPTTRDEWMEVPGIGSSIADDLVEFQQTGQSTRLLFFQRSDPSYQVILSFEHIEGITLQRARELYNRGITSIKKLWPQLTRGQQLSYYYRNQIDTPIEYSELDRIDGMIRDALSVLQISCAMVGSYRRSRSSSNEITLLVLGDRDTLRNAFDIFRDHDWIVAVFPSEGMPSPSNLHSSVAEFGLSPEEEVTQQERIRLLRQETIRREALRRQAIKQGGKWSGLVRFPSNTNVHRFGESEHTNVHRFGESEHTNVHRFGESEHTNVHRMTIYSASLDHYDYRLFYLTGSSEFIRKCQARATQLGYKLTEDGLYDSTGKLLPASSEGDIMNHLKIIYYPPSARSSGGTRDLITIG